SCGDKQEWKDKGHAASLCLVPVSLCPPTSLSWCRGSAWTQLQGLKSSSLLLFSGPEIHFILLFSRQGKLRLQKWYTTLPEKEKKKITREIVQIILARNQKTSSFVDWKDLKLVYKRYASLYFCCAIEDQDNELLTLEVVHRYVELLDRYFGNVCELDIIFNFEKAYFILDEFIMGGEVQETSKKSAVKAMEDSDMLQETVEEYMNKPAF
uniref:Adaptor related protein complex 1 subunit sigma 3 n=2 Tax=Dromaius novaehollandiae TaxID=8790 RepID=A0A8C4P2X6_DRONO